MFHLGDAFEKLVAWNPSIPLTRIDKYRQGSLPGTPNIPSHFSFMNRHIHEKLSLKRVVVLKDMFHEIGALLNGEVESLASNEIRLPKEDLRSGFPKLPSGGLGTRDLDAGSVARYYGSFVAWHATVLASATRPLWTLVSVSCSPWESGAKTRRSTRRMGTRRRQ
jgi:hypothetical protein